MEPWPTTTTSMLIRKWGDGFAGFPGITTLPSAVVPVAAAFPADRVVDLEAGQVVDLEASPEDPADSLEVDPADFPQVADSPAVADSLEVEDSPEDPAEAPAVA